MKLKYIWPELYHSFFPRELLSFEFFETKATCNSCAKALPRYTKKDYYENHLKCCTFQPYIPNFAIGAILQDRKDRFQKVQGLLREKITRREFLLPVGLVAPVSYQIDFVENKSEIFGRDENFLCGFYDKEMNQCGAWQYRGAVCTSFYCLSSYGKKGFQFWNLVSDFQTYVEMALMEDALIHLGYSPRQLSEQLRYIKWDSGEKPTRALRTSSSLSPALFKQLWADHHEDIEDFYRKCYIHVQGLNRKGYKEAMGERGIQLEEKLIQASRQLQFVSEKSGKGK